MSKPIITDWDDLFEQWGEPEVRRAFVAPENQGALWLRSVPSWLAKKDAERVAESLSIARSHLENARSAKMWSMIATAIATASAAVAIHTYFSNLV